MSYHASDEVLSQRVDDLRDTVDDLRGEMRGNFADVRAEIRGLRVRVDTLLLAMVGIIATLAIKL